MRAMSFAPRWRIRRLSTKLALASRRAIWILDAIHPIRALGLLGKDRTFLPGCRECCRSLRRVRRQPKRRDLASQYTIRMPDAIHPISASGCLEKGLTFLQGLLQLRR